MCHLLFEFQNLVLKMYMHSCQNGAYNVKLWIAKQGYITIYMLHNIEINFFTIVKTYGGKLVLEDLLASKL